MEIICFLSGQVSKDGKFLSILCKNQRLIKGSGHV